MLQEIIPGFWRAAAKKELVQKPCRKEDILQRRFEWRPDDRCDLSVGRFIDDLDDLAHIQSGKLGKLRAACAYFILERVWENKRTLSWVCDPTPYPQAVVERHCRKTWKSVSRDEHDITSAKKSAPLALLTTLQVDIMHGFFMALF